MKHSFVLLLTAGIPILTGSQTLEKETPTSPEETRSGIATVPQEI